MTGDGSASLRLHPVVSAGRHGPMVRCDLRGIGDREGTGMHPSTSKGCAYIGSFGWYFIPRWSSPFRRSPAQDASCMTPGNRPPAHTASRAVRPAESHAAGFIAPGRSGHVPVAVSGAVWALIRDGPSSWGGAGNRPHTRQEDPEARLGLLEVLPVAELLDYSRLRSHASRITRLPPAAPAVLTPSRPSAPGQLPGRPPAHS